MISEKVCVFVCGGGGGGGADMAPLAPPLAHSIFILFIFLCEYNHKIQKQKQWQLYKIN